MLSTVREGRKAPLVCPTCECRLNFFDYGNDTVLAHHFPHDYDSTRDAQGHVCENIGKVWAVNSSKVKHLD